MFIQASTESACIMCNVAKFNLTFVSNDPSPLKEVVSKENVNHWWFLKYHQSIILNFRLYVFEFYGREILTLLKFCYIIIAFSIGVRELIVINLVVWQKTKIWKKEKLYFIWWINEKFIIETELNARIQLLKIKERCYGKIFQNKKHYWNVLDCNVSEKPCFALCPKCTWQFRSSEEALVYSSTESRLLNSLISLSTT